MVQTINWDIYKADIDRWADAIRRLASEYRYPAYMHLRDFLYAVYGQDEKLFKYLTEKVRANAGLGDEK